MGPRILVLLLTLSLFLTAIHAGARGCTKNDMSTFRACLGKGFESRIEGCEAGTAGEGMRSKTEWKKCKYAEKMLRRCGHNCSEEKECADNSQRTAVCRFLASAGYCDSDSKYYEWLSSNCARSCGFCEVEEEGECADNSQHTADCGGWASAGYCDSDSEYYDWMSSNCYRSCGFCEVEETEEEGECADNSQHTANCGGWASAGYCDSDRGYSVKRKFSKAWMKSNCYRSCGFCEVEETEEEGGSEFTPAPNVGYEIKMLDGSASGYSLTPKSDMRNGHSYWVHIEQNDPSDDCTRWEIISKNHKGQKCFNIKSTCDRNAGMMLVVHSDTRTNGDGRALVHKTPHNPDDECWAIKTVNVGGLVRYKLRKSQGRQKDKYLVSRVQRNGESYWVDVTADVSAPILWQIYESSSRSSESYRRHTHTKFSPSHAVAEPTEYTEGEGGNDGCPGGTVRCPDGICKHIHMCDRG